MRAKRQKGGFRGTEGTHLDPPLSTSVATQHVQTRREDHAYGTAHAQYAEGLQTLLVSSLVFMMCHPHISIHFRENL